MEQSVEIRTLRDYLRVIRARRRLIVGTMLVAAGAALVFSLLQPVKYQAESTVTFTNQFFPQGAQQTPQPGQVATPAVETGIELITRPDVLAQVSRDLDGDFGENDLESQVQATLAQPFSSLVRITATGSSGEEAAAIADGVADATREIAQRETRAYYLEQARITRNDDLRVTAKTIDPVEIVREADVPATPASPKPLRNTLFAGVLGLLLGVAIAFLRQALDRRISDAHEIQRDVGLPLVGYVREETLGTAGAVSNGDLRASAEDQEAFRIIRANVDFLAGQSGTRTLGVTSPLAGEGKSTVAAGIAYANALAGRKTVLLECDLRRPVLAQRFGFDPAPGLSEYLLGDALPGDVLRAVEVEGSSAEPLVVIPAGVSALQPAELIGSAAFRAFLEQIGRAYETLVADCTPLLPVGDALELLPQLEAVLICLRLAQTTRDQAIAARDALARLPERPTGLVVTGLDRGDEDDYSGYYSTYVDSEPEPAGDARG